MTIHHNKFNYYYTVYIIYIKKQIIFLVSNYGKFFDKCLQIRNLKGGYMDNFNQQQVPGQQGQAASRPAIQGGVTEEMKKTYENIFNNYGQDAANNWLKQQILNKHVNLQGENDTFLREIEAKHSELYSVPVVREAILAFIDMDLDLSANLKDQGFQDAMEHIANIYNAGYEAGQNIKRQNDSAKARMTSAVNTSAPHYQSNKLFTRSEIKAMSPDDFVRNEKAIFEQLNKGLIK